MKSFYDGLTESGVEVTDKIETFKNEKYPHLAPMQKWASSCDEQLEYEPAQIKWRPGPKHKAKPILKGKDAIEY